MNPITTLERILFGQNATPHTRLETAVKHAMDSISSAVELPVVSGTDNGKLLGVSSGKWQKVDAPSFAPFAVTATLSSDASGVTATFNKKAAELYTAIEGGRLVKITDDDNTVSVVSIVAVKDGTGNSAKYSFGYFNESGILFSVEELAGTADVVMTTTVETTTPAETT